MLVVMFEEAGEARLILTRRSTAMRTHRGEVSFPGGRIEAGEDATAAALREAREEIALDPALVTVVGWIRPVMTMVSASLIMPVLATVERRPALTPSPREVARVFDVSLAELAAPDVFHEERWSVPGRAVRGERGRLRPGVVLRGVRGDDLGRDGAHDPRVVEHRPDGTELSRSATGCLDRPDAAAVRGQVPSANASAHTRAIASLARSIRRSTTAEPDVPSSP